MPKIYFGHFLGGNLFFSHYLLGNLFFIQGMYLIISFSVIFLMYIFDKKITYIAVILIMVAGMFHNYLNSYLNVTKNSNIEIINSERLTKFLSNKKNQIVKKKIFTYLFMNLM